MVSEKSLNTVSYKGVSKFFSETKQMELHLFDGGDSFNSANI